MKPAKRRFHHNIQTRTSATALNVKREKKHYIQILDMDRYVNALNDWD